MTYQSQIVESKVYGRRVLAVASGGGHWNQLMILRPAFSGMDVYYTTTMANLDQVESVPNTFVVSDCNRNEIWKTIKGLLGIARVTLKVRPHVIISTGAAPGLLAIACGRLMGARTIWVDSFANSESLSLSGRLAGWISDLQLTQWRHLSRAKGPRYFGGIL